MARTSILRADSPLETTELDESSPELDAKRRISNITATSISSFPESALPSDSEGPIPYFNTKPRPTFRVGSLRRSPLPDRLSPGLRPPKHSPRRPRSRESDVPSIQEPAPLVLLHVTVLPPKLPWSRTVTEALLPAEIKHRFGVLRAQISGLVAQRGILVQHPREEFEVLEESVLEALGLIPERIGVDGQYRPRTPSTIIDGDGDDEEQEDQTPCESCQKCHGKDVGAGWYIRVYAANGLMRAGAWAAAWSEMERVDVEILACIPDAVRSQLDEAQAVEERDQQREYTVRHLHTPVQRQIQSTEQQHGEANLSPHQNQITTPMQQNRITVSPDQNTTATFPHQQRHKDDLPQIYRPKDIPLNILLRNYVYLLLRDRRNLAILFLGLTLMLSTFHGLLGPTNRDSGVTLFEGDLRVVGEVVPSKGLWSDDVQSRNTVLQSKSEGQTGQVSKHKDQVRKSTQHLHGSDRKGLTLVETHNPAADEPASQPADTSDLNIDTEAQKSPNPALIFGFLE